jgi:DNA-binding CsgD family transcriptional regulator
VTVPTDDAELEWKFLARSLLDLCGSAAALLDGHGRIRAANRALEELTEASPGALIDRRLDDLGGSEAAAATTRTTIAAALEGATAPFEIDLTTTSSRSLLLQVKPQLVGLPGRPALLLKVVGWRVAPKGGLPRYVGGDHYELSSRFEDFGVLLNVWSAAGRGSRGDLLGERCHRALHELEAPCAGCPAFLQQPPPVAGLAMVVIPRSTTQLRLDVVQVRVLSPTSIAVSVWQVGEALLSQLINGKLRAMAERRGLSARECTVLEFLVLGRSNDEIATHLGVSERTVKYYKRSVLQKLGAESKYDLMRLIV